MINNRRTSLEIISDILEICIVARRKTRIVYKANLNFHIVNKYLNILLEKGLLIKNNRIYQTTDKGKHYLNIVEPALSILR